MRRSFAALGFALAWLAWWGGAAGRAAEEAGGPLRVFAAASLTEVMQALTPRFEGVRIAANLGASSELARQIQDGAPADAFVSASPEWIDFLRNAGALEGEAAVFARNQLVCIAPPGSPLRERQLRDPAALVERGLAAGDRVAIADAGVPAGEAARQALGRLGLLEAYRPLLIGQKDVRAVLHAVEQGEVQAGFVYATDARVSKVELLFAFDPKSHTPIEYLAGVVRGSPNAAAARRFVDFLRGEAARAVLREAGFALP